MKTMVVYDTVFGNTEKVAQEIGKALGETGEVEVLRVGVVRMEQLKGLDLLIVGSPTRAFQATKPTKEFLKNIPKNGLKGVKVAAFDTRADVQEVNSAVLTSMVKIFGYAAEPIAKSLEKKGGISAAAPAGFFVDGKEGPMKAGELERAATWAGGMVSQK